MYPEVFKDIRPCRLMSVYQRILTVIHKKKKIQQDATVHQNFISYLYEAQHVSSDTRPIIRSLKLHWQPLVLQR